MFKNYLKTTWRNLSRYKFISFVNLFGLTAGITCCLLISVYIIHEVSYDRYHKNADNVYRVERTFINAETGDISLQLGAVAPPFGPLLKNDFSEIKVLTSILPTGNQTFKYKDKLFNEDHLYFTDSNLLKIFDVQVVKGNAANALSEPYSVMITEEIARKYFDREDPLNKVLLVGQQYNCKVTGVFKSFPANAHMHPEIMLSFSTLNDPAIYGAEQLKSNWGNNAFYDYLLLPEGYDAAKLQARLSAAWWQY